MKTAVGQARAWEVTTMPMHGTVWLYVRSKKKTQAYMIVT